MVVKVCIKDIIEKFKLEFISGEEGIDCFILISDILCLGIEMVGYFIYYLVECI